MATLIWGVKTSLLQYLTGMARGAIEVFDDAEVTEHGICFPSADEAQHPLAFRGAVLMTGHGGLLRISLGDPVIHREDDGRWLLSARRADGQRIPVADIEQFTQDHTGLVQAGVTTLTEQGVSVFDGQYPAGTTLDSPTITL